MGRATDSPGAFETDKHTKPTRKAYAASAAPLREEPSDEVKSAGPLGWRCSELEIGLLGLALETGGYALAQSSAITLPSPGKGPAKDTSSLSHHPDIKRAPVFTQAPPILRRCLSTLTGQQAKCFEQHWQTLGISEFIHQIWSDLLQ